MHKAAYVNK